MHNEKDLSYLKNNIYSSNSKGDIKLNQSQSLSSQFFNGYNSHKESKNSKDLLSENHQFKNYNEQSSLSEENCLETESFLLEDICITNQTRDFLKSAYSEPISFMKLLFEKDDNISINPSIETSNTTNHKLIGINNKIDIFSTFY